MKKFLTFVLVLAMVLSVSSFAMAATPEEDLQAAINAGGTVTLGSKITLTNTLTIPAGVTVTLDLKGKSISWEQNTTVTENTEMISNNGNLIIKDTVGGGKISYKYTGGNLGTSYHANTITSLPGSSLTVEGGTIENITYDSAIIAYAIDGQTNGNLGDVSVTIKGGTITSLRQAIRIFANSTVNTGTLTISGGDITGRVIVQNANAYANKAVLDITGGTFNANAYKTDVLYVGGSNSATIDMDADVSGGDFKGEITDTNVEKFISGGTFPADTDSNLIKDGSFKATIDDGDGNPADDVLVVGGSEDKLKENLKEAVEELIDDGADAEDIRVMVDAPDSSTNVAFKTGDLPGGVIVDGEVTVNGVQPSGGLPMPTPELPQETNKPSTGGGYYYVGVRYNGGNSFSTDRSDVPVAVLIDGQPVSFTGNGSNFVVDCINPGASKITIVWNTIKVDAGFTPDANAYCAQAVIPKTGGMSFWAAIAQFLGF